MAIGDTRTAGVLRRRSWQRAYAVRLFSSDIVVVLAAVFGSQFIWFGLETVEVEAPQPFSLGASYTVVSLVASCVTSGPPLCRSFGNVPNALPPNSKSISSKLTWVISLNKKKIVGKVTKMLNASQPQSTS